MAETGSWNGHRFVVSPTLMRSFSALTVRGSSEVEEKVSDEQKYVRRVSGNPVETTMQVYLNAYLGCDVRAEAMGFVEDARSGATGYMYIGGRKLIAGQLMLTEAGTEEIEISPGGQWISCAVSLKFRQCEKEGGSTGSSSGSSTGSSSGSSTVKQSVRVEPVAGGTGESAISKAAQYIEEMMQRVKAAKKQSQALVRGGGGGQFSAAAKE